jgi:hypothetical protein
MPYLERSRITLKHLIVTFEELIAPLSKGKVMVVVECLCIEACEQPDIMDELSAILNLGFGTGYDEWDDFLNYGFVVIEGESSPEFMTEVTLLIDYLRNEKFRSLIQADLFVDGVLQASSWTMDLEGMNKPDAFMQPAKSVVIRFPMEKIKRRKDTDIKN